MKKWVGLLLIAVWSVGCSNKPESSDIPKINGYWEIEKVVLSDGSKKEYPMNETYDYFEIKNNQGFRKKVMPQLDGSFLTNDAQEAVQVVFADDRTYLEYKTDYAKWKEELRSLSDTEMVLLNADKKEFHYKKTGPINLNTDGKKAQ